MQALFSLAVLSLGLVVGSFLGAFSYRKPRGISIIVGRSFCPHCKSKIAWFHNIPLFSFLFLRGRCRECGKKISRRYPLLEAGTAGLFLAFAKFTADCSSLSGQNLLCSWSQAFGPWIY